MKQPEVKICGIRTKQDAVYLNENRADYAGFVLFYPKSKRFITIEKAVPIMKALNSDIKKVAVTVSPSVSQLRQIECAGFDFIQIHGILDRQVLEESRIPIFRAVNVSGKVKYLKLEQSPNIAGYVLDGKVPGNGEIFDWNLIKKFNRQNKLLILAGGLNAENVKKAVLEVQPDVVDVSSGVESEGMDGKDPAKIKAFMKQVRE